MVWNTVFHTGLICTIYINFNRCHSFLFLLISLLCLDLQDTLFVFIRGVETIRKVAAVEVDPDGADKTGTKEGLPDNDLALFLLGYDLINVGSVEEEDTSEVIPVFEDFDGDTVNGLGFVEVADATDNEPGKIRAFTSSGDVKNSSTTKNVPTDRKQTQISHRGHCDVGSNKICSDACVVVATDPVLKKVELK